MKKLLGFLIGFLKKKESDEMGNQAKYIAIHCSATKPNQDVDAATIRGWHTAPKPRGRGWRDIGYAYIIKRDGTVEKGRDLDNDGDVDEEVGAHVAGFNSQAIGICLIGGVNMLGKADSNFTRHQYAALEKLVKQLKRKFPDAIVQGHRDFPRVAKACPSFDAVAWWGE